MLEAKALSRRLRGHQQSARSSSAAAARARGGHRRGGQLPRQPGRGGGGARAAPSSAHRVRRRRRGGQGAPVQAGPLSSPTSTARPRSRLLSHAALRPRSSTPARRGRRRGGGAKGLRWRLSMMSARGRAACVRAALVRRARVRPVRARGEAAEAAELRRSRPKAAPSCACVRRRRRAPRREARSTTQDREADEPRATRGARGRLALDATQRERPAARASCAEAKKESEAAEARARPRARRRHRAHTRGTRRRHRARPQRRCHRRAPGRARAGGGGGRLPTMARRSCRRREAPTRGVCDAPPAQVRARRRGVVEPLRDVQEPPRRRPTRARARLRCC